MPGIALKAIRPDSDSMQIEVHFESGSVIEYPSEHLEDSLILQALFHDVLVRLDARPTLISKRKGTHVLLTGPEDARVRFDGSDALELYADRVAAQ